MEFWGVEVKAGQPLKVKPGEEKVIHLSQASLGEFKTKGNESVPLFLKFDDQKLVLGTLSTENFPQLSFDLVFEKEFELSHNWKHGSVFFLGYKAFTPEDATDDHDDFDTDSDDEELEDLPLISGENGKAGSTITTQKAASKPESSEKQVKLVEPSKDDEDDDSSDQDDEDDDDDDAMSFESGDDSDDDSDEESEETLKKVELGKKRPSDAAHNTPVPAKKAKPATQKTDVKKGGHTATPHPSKKAGKTPANSDQAKPQTPKSGGQFSCKSCSKSFTSEVGLQSHTKAKHGGS